MRTGVDKDDARQRRRSKWLIVQEHVGSGLAHVNPNGHHLFAGLNEGIQVAAVAGFFLLRPPLGWGFGAAEQKFRCVGETAALKLDVTEIAGGRVGGSEAPCGSER
jgi:hypothetical protein